MHIPKHSMGGQATKHRPLWTNSKTITAIKRKSQAYKRYRETRDEQDYIKYRRTSNRVKTEVRKAVRDFERQIANEAKANPKAFYKYARSKMKIRATVADLERPDGTMTETNVDKAELLNSYFMSVFTQESLENIPTFERTLHNTEELTNFMITDEKVEKILKTTKPPGPDGSILVLWLKWRMNWLNLSEHYSQNHTMRQPYHNAGKKEILHQYLRRARNS